VNPQLLALYQSTLEAMQGPNNNESSGTRGCKVFFESASFLLRLIIYIGVLLGLEKKAGKIKKYGERGKILQICYL
jgi:hypothetical protein